jgi:hypothetical protein
MAVRLAHIDESLWDRKRINVSILPVSFRMWPTAGVFIVIVIIIIIKQNELIKYMAPAFFQSFLRVLCRVVV